MNSRPVLKAELHCHIEGTASPALVASQAAKYGIDTAAFLRDGVFVWHDFSTFLATYDATAKLFRNETDYAQLAEDHLSALARDGTIYSEFFISPDHAEAAGLSPKAYVAGLAEGVERARAKTGIECRMIVIGIRHFGVGKVEAAARFAARLGHPLIAGFGMAGEETFGEMEDYLRAFEIAREAGLGLTVHAGEFAGPESVAAAIGHLKPARIGHGVRAIEDETVMRRLADEGITLECCIGSNIALGLYSLDTHPFGRLRAAGCRMTLNSDDPAFFQTSLRQEYELAARQFGLRDADLLQVTRTAIEASFLDRRRRAELLTKLPAPGRG